MPFECKAVTYTTNALPLTLKTVSLPVEQKDGQFVVGENDILVKVHYAALNPVDSILKNSAYGWLSKSEKGFGKDFSGDVAAIGAKAAAQTSLSVGDRVAGLNQKIFKNGTLSEYTLVNAFDMSGKATTKIPDEMPYDKAAAFPLVLGTAHQMFESALKGNSYKKVLILGGGTSVGRFAVQLAKNVYGSEEIVVTCSERSAETLKGFGATSYIDYSKHKSLLEPVLEHVKTAGPFDLILDTCGNSDLFGHMTSILRNRSEGGSYISVSGDSKYDYSKMTVSAYILNGLHLVVRSLRLALGYLPYHYKLAMLDLDHDRTELLIRYIMDGKVLICIDSEYPLEDFQEAVDRQVSNKAQGKVLVKISD